jgi:FkbM family methyltransferase
VLISIEAVRTSVSAVHYGISRKARAVATGQSPVSNSCQIPNVRSLYGELGLSPNSGVFVEIGGFDGETFSNTSFLADQGWRGLYVEPIPELCASIRARHLLNRVAVERAAVGEAAGLTTLHLMGALWTASEKTKEAYAEIDWAKSETSAARSIVVPTRSLGDVLSRSHPGKTRSDGHRRRGWRRANCKGSLGESLATEGPGC